MTAGRRIRLCSLADLDATGAKGVVLGTWPDVREIAVVRDGQGVRAYENRCPHLEASLEVVPDRFLDATREHLVCTTHGARFRIGDGVCVWGPCLGEALTGVPITLAGGEVYLAGD